MICTIDNKDKEMPAGEKKSPFKRVLSGVIFLVLFAVTYIFANGKYEGNMQIAVYCLELLLLGMSLGSFISCRDTKPVDEKKFRLKQGFSKRTILAFVMVLIVIPATIFFGAYFLEDRKYYFISLMIILETIVPFLLMFESKKPDAREIVIISVLCALTVCGRMAFYMLPQFKPALAIIIISGIAFGGEAGFLVGAVSAFVSNFFFGQGAWTPWQMFCNGIVGFLAGILFQKGFLRTTKLSLCLYGLLSGVVIYGGIMNPASVIMYQPNPTWQMFASSYVMGFPFDLLNGFSTAFFLWVIGEPMMDKLSRIKIKYNL